ncbi:MAG: T9SS type A sorting domain-containing protein, partial [Rufibacter sp.]
SEWADNTLLPGWYVSANVILTQVAATPGNDETTGLKSYGLANNEDRALGLVVANSTETAYLGLHVKNNSGATLTHFYLSYAAEQWYNDKAASTLRVSYKKQAQGQTVSLTSGDWTNLPELDATSSYNQGARGNLDGNVQKVEKVKVYFSLALAAGEELILRWADVQATAKNRAGIDDVTFAVDNRKITSYFLREVRKNTMGDVSNLAHWSSTSDGEGASPTSFSTEDQEFNITKSGASFGASVTLPASSKFVLGDSVTSLSFTIPSTVVLNGYIDVMANATLYINSSTPPTLGKISSMSTVVYGTGSLEIATVTYGNLQIDGGEVKRLKSKTQVTGQLSIKGGGKLDLGNYDLLMKDHKKFTQYDSTSYIKTTGNGKVKIQLKSGEEATVPVGSGKFTPIHLKHNGGEADTFGIRVIDLVYTSYVNDQPQGGLIDQKVVNKTWFIEEAQKGGSNMEVTLYWRAPDTLRGFNADSAFVAHFENGVWDKVAGKKATLSNGMYRISRTGITSFSPFTTMSAAAASPPTLPVELLYFDAKRENGKVFFSWATASEQNNAFFGIEQSLDGKAFRQVGEPIEGAGHSATIRRYQTALPLEIPQTIYFRLKQTDWDGSSSYSKVVSVRFNGSNAESAVVMSAFPNPSGGLVYFKAAYLREGEATVQLFHANGQQVLQRQVRVQGGRTMGVDIRQLPAGVYVARVHYADQQSILRLVRR